MFFQIYLGPRFDGMYFHSGQWLRFFPDPVNVDCRPRKILRRLSAAGTGNPGTEEKENISLYRFMAVSSDVAASEGGLVMRWLHPGNADYVNAGCWTRHEASIAASNTSQCGTVAYLITVLEDGKRLIVESESFINGFKATKEYVFVKVQAQVVWPNGKKPKG